MAGRKVFVGSLPHNISDATLRGTFEQYGQVEDVFIKPGCDPGRQWAFVTFATAEQALHAKECCDRVLTFPGAERPCDVMVAKNQGMFGQASDTPAHVPPTSASADGPKKIFVGSLPDNVTDSMLRAEFTKFGTIVDIYVKTGCEPGRQWAFVTFSTHAEAQLAKVSTDRILVMPGQYKACEVTLARNQGMFGQDPLHQTGDLQAAGYDAAYQDPAAQGPRKIFVGSLPDHISEGMLRAEFAKYGEIVDIFIKTGCEAGRQWAFVTFATADQANYAKDSTDRTLMFAGADRACEVMVARNQGKFGQDPVESGGAAPVQDYAVGGMQPPPPTAPPPAHLTPWRCYYTAAGLPYYHNHSTNVTQWECPPELAPAGTTSFRQEQKRPVVRPGAAAQQPAVRQGRYSPY